MAGFSLSGGQEQGEEGTDGIHPESFFLYPGGTAGSAASGGARGFELWQHHQHQIQLRQQQFYSVSSGALLAFGGSDEPIAPAAGRSGPKGGAGGMSCQDCGNQAKKDCVHLRCRTCCKSRGFQCSTHVKSTWVPAARRRERQQQQLAAPSGQPPPGPASSGGPETSKRPRDLSTRLPTVISTTMSAGTEGDLSFPAEVTSPAVFRCVRVSPVDEAADQFAYQTSVSIGGHLFKGILYDQGPDSQFSPATTPRQQLLAGESSSAGGNGASLIACTGTSSSAVAATSGLLDPSSLYPIPLNVFMAGTHFFPNQPRT